MRMIAALFGTIGIAASISCAATPSIPIAPDEPATLRVENRAFLDMNIYILRGAERIKLGTVTGNSTREFVVRREIVSSGAVFRFLADPIGGNRSPISDEITINPGDRIDIVIPPG